MNTLLAFLISLISIFLFYFLFFKIYILAFGKEFIKNNFSKKTLIIFGLIIFTGFLLCIATLSKNQFVYFWDYGGYWTNSYNLMNSLYENPTKTLQDVYMSILNSDYNLILPLIISLPLKIFGITFSRYVLINYLVFFIPTAFVTISLFLKITAMNKKNPLKKSLIAAFITISSFTIPLRAMLIGYIDIAILLPILLLFSIIIDYSPTQNLKNNFKKNFFIGILLVISFLFRRYSAFFLIGFILSFFSTEFLRIVINHKKNKLPYDIKKLFLNFLTIGCITICIMVTFFAPLVFRILGENYSDMYIGYNLSFIEKTKQILNRFGALFLCLSMLGIITSFYKKQHRFIVTVSILTFFITTILFFKVQRMDIHHLYIISVPILILSYLGIYNILCFNKILSGLLFILLALNPIYFFSNTAQDILSPLSPLFSVKHTPLFRNDLTSIYELSDYLKKFTNSNIYVLASSSILNSEVLNSIEKPYNNEAIPSLAKTHDVDLRDGFPSAFLTSKLIVVANPIQLHLSDGSQEVVRYLAENVQNPNSYIGRHFEKQPVVFSLDSNVEVFIYKKTSNFTQNDLNQLSDYYMALYPSNPELFKDRILPNN